MPEDAHTTRHCVINDAGFGPCRVKISASSASLRQRYALATDQIAAGRHPISCSTPD